MPSSYSNKHTISLKPYENNMIIRNDTMPIEYDPSISSVDSSNSGLLDIDKLKSNTQQLRNELEKVKQLANAVAESNVNNRIPHTRIYKNQSNTRTNVHKSSGQYSPTEKSVWLKAIEELSSGVGSLALFACKVINYTGKGALKLIDAAEDIADEQYTRSPECFDSIQDEHKRRYLNNMTRKMDDLVSANGESTRLNVHGYNGIGKCYHHGARNNNVNGIQEKYSRQPEKLYKTSYDNNNMEQQKQMDYHHYSTSTRQIPIQVEYNPVVPCDAHVNDPVNLKPFIEANCKVGCYRSVNGDITAVEKGTINADAQIRHNIRLENKVDHIGKEVHFGFNRPHELPQPSTLHLKDMQSSGMNRRLQSSNINQQHQSLEHTAHVTRTMGNPENYRNFPDTKTSIVTIENQGTGSFTDVIGAESRNLKLNDMQTPGQLIIAKAELTAIVEKIKPSSNLTESVDHAISTNVEISAKNSQIEKEGENQESSIIEEKGLMAEITKTCSTSETSSVASRTKRFFFSKKGRKSANSYK
ncbi:uncharacterized protein BdWA1_004111 [Babesia duncani]|nr:hypothetical protein BdWA1_004111 [Babesia duncani]